LGSARAMSVLSILIISDQSVFHKCPVEGEEKPSEAKARTEKRKFDRSVETLRA